jgi:hypothetical protein
MTRADRPGRADRAAADRATAADRAFLAMDAGGEPEQFGVVLLLEAGDGLSSDSVRAVLDERVRAVPRLTRTLVRSPPGRGGPRWVDDEHFDIRRHVRSLRCPAPGDEPALLACALAEVRRRLPRDRPLWSATLVTGLEDNGDRRRWRGRRSTARQARGAWWLPFTGP